MNAKTLHRPTVSPRSPRREGAACVAETGPDTNATLPASTAADRGLTRHRFCSAVCFHAWDQQCRDDSAREIGWVDASSMEGTREVAAALAAVGPKDPASVEGTALAVDWLAVRGGAQRVTQLALCEFLW